ncbi:hypothetical protein F5Y08DRAFT_332971 [Xylaria arbuscula]|nr:hypothetical protein F5Y08DRAFT_332971 [Xylaria arbuscula]
MDHPMSKLGRENPFLLKRDACSDVFGSDWSANICWPARRFPSDQTFPSREVYLEKAWCCAGSSSEDNCYVDQLSTCDMLNSVPCTNLEEGVAEACFTILTSISTSTTSAITFLGFGKLDRSFNVDPGSRQDNKLRQFESTQGLHSAVGYYFLRRRWIAKYVNSIAK